MQDLFLQTAVLPHFRQREIVGLHGRLNDSFRVARRELVLSQVEI